MMIAHKHGCEDFELDGFPVERNLGIVRGNTIQSRPISRTVEPGNIDLIVQHAAQTGANAVIDMRHHANQVTQGITKTLGYETTVSVEQSLLPAL
jgi:uncharacterized protein YbjQ (UPF0145 family)